MPNAVCRYMHFQILMFFFFLFLNFLLFTCSLPAEEQQALDWSQMVWLSALSSVTLDKNCHPFFTFCLDLRGNWSVRSSKISSTSNHYSPFSLCYFLSTHLSTTFSSLCPSLFHFSALLIFSFSYSVFLHFLVFPSRISPFWCPLYLFPASLFLSPLSLWVPSLHIAIIYIIHRASMTHKMLWQLFQVRGEKRELNHSIGSWQFASITEKCPQLPLKHWWRTDSLWQCEFPSVKVWQRECLAWYYSRRFDAFPV